MLEVKGIVGREQCRVAVVGAGISGLACAVKLKEKGFEVKVFDKGFYPGGRLASHLKSETQFDYGAQYFTAREESFRKFLQPFRQNSQVVPWDGRFGEMGKRTSQISMVTPSQERLVGVPTMRSFAEHIVQNKALSVRTGTLVEAIDRFHLDKRERSAWTVRYATSDRTGIESHSSEEFDFVVLSIPPAQAYSLYELSALESFVFRPCLAVLLSFNDVVDISADGIVSEHEIFSWLARDSSKPFRLPGERWVIHCSAEWSAKNYASSEPYILDLALSEFRAVAGGTLPEINFSKLHRWKYAICETTQSSSFMWQPREGIGFCGDWLSAARVESAFLSGTALADAMSI